MPAAVAKGIIISVSIIAAISIAVLENPQVQSWIEEQRRKIAELLRSVGPDLDAQNRRRAEAFAFEGRTIANGDEVQRDASPSIDAVAKATGRSLSAASTMRRIPVTGPKDVDEAEERRKKGREYLAKRNQQMIELQERRKMSESKVSDAPLSPTSFDAMVDSKGNLRESSLLDQKLPSPPAVEPIPEHVQQEMIEVERHLQQPILMSESNTSGFSGWQAGSELANPFGDEYALDRSITPRPASPREPPAERAGSPDVAIPGSFNGSQPQEAAHGGSNDELTYEEQLAIALSLSEQESMASAATVRRRSAEEEAALRRAIQASLKDLDGQQAAFAVAHADSASPAPQTLVDLTPSHVSAAAPRSHGWDSFSFVPAHTSGSHLVPSAPLSDTTDDLYSVTPELTRARLASFDAHQEGAFSGPVGPPQTFDEVPSRAVFSQGAREELASSFFSAASVIPPPPRSQTLDSEIPQLIDISEDAPYEGTRTPTSRTLSSAGFRTDFESETLGSMSAPASRAQSQAGSEVSSVEVVQLEDDSDVDMLSEEGDGIATPDSWSEVGSRGAESEAEDVSQPPSHVLS